MSIARRFIREILFISLFRNPVAYFHSKKNTLLLNHTSANRPNSQTQTFFEENRVYLALVLWRSEEYSI